MRSVIRIGLAIFVMSALAFLISGHGNPGDGFEWGGHLGSAPAVEVFEQQIR